MKFPNKWKQKWLTNIVSYEWVIDTLSDKYIRSEQVLNAKNVEFYEETLNFANQK